MFDKKSLRQLSKNDLIKIIISQQEDIDRHNQRISELEQYVKSFDNAHTPSSKKNKKSKRKDKEDNNKPRFPGKPKGSSGGGIKLPPPDDVVEHSLDICPVSGKPLGEPFGYKKKTIIDLPDKPIRVIEHRIFKYISPATGEIVYKDVKLPKGIYGNNLKSFVVMLKNLTNSHNKISGLVRELGAPSFSNVEVQNISDDCSNKLEKTREKLLKRLIKSKYTHADETGMRRDGISGYIWGAFTKTITIFEATTSRARKIIEEMLNGFKGVIVTDGYNVYDIFPIRQRCWAHLIREFKDLLKKHPEMEDQYERIKRLYENLKLLNKKPPDQKQIEKVKWELEDIVECLKPRNYTKNLRTLIVNGGDDWFTALYYQGVPLQNNHAERELRSIVLLRKTIGCYRNEKGKRWIDIVLSVLHTWKLQGKNIFQQLRMTFA